jgi:hypothetical protein
LLLTGLALSFATEHVSKVFIKQQEDSVMDILGAFVHLCAVFGFIFLIDRVITLAVTTYDGSPRGGLFFCLCNRKKGYGFFSKGLREAKRMRIVFNNFLVNDVLYDTNLAAIHEADYDSHDDDPVEAVTYIHFKESNLL